MFSSRELGLIGLTIGFFGTLGMLWGGLESFILVKPKGTMDKSDVTFVCWSDESNMDFDYDLVLSDIASFKRHSLVNRIGKFLLAIGFALQFIALWMDP